MTAYQTISIDKRLCAGTGFCERIAPELFEVRHDGLARVVAEVDTAAREGLAEDAEVNCPTGAITLEPLAR